MDKKRDTYSILFTLTSTKYLIGLMFTLHGSLTKGYPIYEDFAQRQTP